MEENDVIREDANSCVGSDVVVKILRGEDTDCHAKPMSRVPGLENDYADVLASAESEAVADMMVMAACSLMSGWKVK